MDKMQPIGVLDSGVGGLSVLKCLHQMLPYEDFIYVAFCFVYCVLLLIFVCFVIFKFYAFLLVYRF